MIMNWIWTGILFISLFSALLTGSAGALSAAVTEGAQAGFTLAVSLAGSLCLWTGVGKLMESAGITRALSSILQPLLQLVFPSTEQNPRLREHLSATICANFLGLGNAATPMGIQAVKEMVDPDNPRMATDEMCRLIVLNTASIQLIPATVAALRSSLGCGSPFDILPAVWITSLCSAGSGVLSAFLIGRFFRYD